MEEAVSYGTKAQELVEVIIMIEPMGAVRTTRKGQHTERAQKYHKWKQAVEWLWREAMIKQKLPLNTTLSSEIVSLEFGLEIPSLETKSLSKAELAKRKAMIGKPHMKKPDIDNLFKAFVDTICYKGDDSHIHTIGKMKKVYADRGEGYIKIKFFI